MNPKASEYEEDLAVMFIYDDDDKEYDEVVER
jgi:hypothetical protein